MFFGILLSLTVLSVVVNGISGNLFHSNAHSQEISNPSLDIDKPHILQSLLKASSSAKSTTLHNGKIVHPISSTTLPHQCELITNDLCQDKWYNMTSFPNLFKHSSQIEADDDIKRYYDLLKSNCSHELHFFLCSTHFPICLRNYDRQLPPCRPVCERVRQNCAPLMAKFHFEWPSTLDCLNFPLENNSENQLCMDTNAVFDDENHRKLHGHLIMYEKERLNNNLGDHRTFDMAYVFSPNHDYDDEDDFEFWENFNQTNKSEVFDISEKKCNCECREPFIQINDPNSFYFNKVHTGKLKNCIYPCYHPSLYQTTESDRIQYWLKMWTFISLICVMVNFLFYFFIVMRKLVRTNMMGNYEKILPFIRSKQLYMSHLAILLCFLLRLIFGHQSIACMEGIPRTSNTNNIIHNVGWKNSQCILVFTILFYGTMASYVWWIAENFKKFLCLTHGSSFEKIYVFIKPLTFLGWILPLIQLLVSLSISAVESDTFAGLCFISATSSYTRSNKDVNMIALVIGPMAIYLSAGWLILLIIFLSRNKEQCSKTLRISNLSLIYLLLNGLLKTGLFFLFIIEYRDAKKWLLNALCRQCPEELQAVFPIETFVRMKYCLWILMPIFDLLSCFDEVSNLDAIEKSLFILRGSQLTNENVNQFSLAYMTSSLAHNEGRPVKDGTCSSQISLQDQESLQGQSAYSSMRKLICSSTSISHAQMI